MMRAAAEARDKSKLPKSQRPKPLGVTILTSMDNEALRGVGISGPVSRRVVKLVRLAQRAGLGGVVASPHEVRSIRRACGKDFLVVIPGVRPEVGGGAARATRPDRRRDDQTRVATPAEAIRADADDLVVGRPIAVAPDPESAARAILEEIGSALPRPAFLTTNTAPEVRELSQGVSLGKRGFRPASPGRGERKEFHRNARTAFLPPLPGARVVRNPG